MLFRSGKVFFWPTRKRVETLLCARAYRNRSHTVITVDTLKLLEAHGKQTTVSRINSGAAVYKAVERGSMTFKSSANLLPNDGVAELAVEYSVPSVSVASCAVRVEEMECGVTKSLIWEQWAT